MAGYCYYNISDKTSLSVGPVIVNVCLKATVIMIDSRNAD